MPELGLGTWEMGGRKDHDQSNDDEADVQAIKRALDQGLTHIDTAEIYADGYTEILVGKAIAGYDRTKIFLASKVQANNLGYDNVLRACVDSLKRLGTDFLDLYLLHRYSSSFPLKDSIRALDKLVADGLVKNIGVCNFTAEHLAEAQSYTNNKIVCNQVHYNLEFREPEKKNLLAYCQNNDVFLSAWRPVQKGSLLNNIPLVLQETCDKYKKTPAQVAINWLISQPNVITLSKMRNPKHLEENLGALGWQMELEDIEKLRTQYPNQQSVSDAVPLA